MHKVFLSILALLGLKYGTTLVTDCDSPVYCQGKLLEVIQGARLFNDSKTFVDLSQKNSQKVTLENFNKLLSETKNNPSTKDISEFVKANFESVSELENWIPTDYKNNSKFLDKIKNEDVKEYASNLIQIWPKLGRKVKNFVFENEDRYSFIPIPNGFIIPGGRFSEIYYWDTYWIIKGLLISDMPETVRGILENFISLINRFGFIPNGSRVYYLNRSQPPLFVPMVSLYIEATNNLTWLSQNIQSMETELNWWLNNRIVDIKKNGKRYKLAHFDVKSPSPRPESYNEDVKTCSNLSEDKMKECYRSLKSAAESGWDFSSRWIFNPDGSVGTNLSMIQTSRLVNVDLNSFLCQSFRELSHFYKLLGNGKKSKYWNQMESSWKRAIQDILYNKEDKIWYDWDIELNKHRKEFYPSNFAPLWSNCFDLSNKKEIGKNAFNYFQNSKLKNFPGGIPTSLLKSGQQWDFPNAWPPLQEIIILGLKNTDNQQAVELSKLLSERILRAYMSGFKKYKEMFEKYDAINVGEYGGGGEYVVQSGFGWTNGVALSLIQSLYI